MATIKHLKVSRGVIDIATSGGHEEDVGCNTKSTQLNLSQLQLGEAFTTMKIHTIKRRDL